MATEDFRRIFESLRVPVVVADAKGRVAFANAAFVELAAQDARSLPGSELAALFVSGDRRRLLQNVARVGEGKAASAFLDAQLSPHGVVTRWVSVALQPWFDAREKAAGVVAVVTDIAAHRETESALNLVSARLLSLAEASPQPMMVETEPGDVELVNEPFCRLLGLESAPQSLSGLPVREVLARSPLLDVANVEKMRVKAGQTGRLVLRTEDGREVTLERHRIVVDDEGAGAVWIPREEAPGARGGRKADAEIALIEKIGEELSVALEGLSTISIRAQQMEIDPAMVEHFQRIRTSTETAMAAIGDLVDFSKLSGGVVLHKSGFRLRAALAELISRVAANAEERGCRLRVRVEQDVSDALEGDVERLQLVLKNLLDNAFVILPGAEVTLQITPEYMTETGIQLSFSVALASAESRELPAKVSADAGMGVAVARFMVTAMGGKLAVASRPGGDALYAFTIEFPVLPAPEPAPRPSYASLVAMPVLVVSADSEQRSGLANALRGWRMVPLEADNAPMAMALLERFDKEGSPVPLVILANRLPVQDGFLLAFRIKHHPRLASTLVMMLANEGKPGDAIACRENGIAAYMRYPIGSRQLNEAIMAVTGASVDADEAPTLVTRHSLREQRKGATILLVDPSRDSQILAAHFFGRQDCSVVVAQDVQETLSALDQDVYDLVLVDTSLPGFEGEDAPQRLRERLSREPEATYLVAVSVEHTPQFRERKLAIGFSATIGKPFRKDDLLALLRLAGRLSPPGDAKS